MFKLGLAMLGVGGICFVALMTVLGPFGPCINGPQTTTLFGGLFSGSAQEFDERKQAWVS